MDWHHTNASMFRHIARQYTHAHTQKMIAPHMVVLNSFVHLSLYEYNKNIYFVYIYIQIYTEDILLCGIYVVF